MGETPTVTSGTAGAQGMQNFRDLGGIPTAAGGRTRYGVLYRGDVPRLGDPAPASAISWPPATVVDLRSAEETEETHPLARAAGEIHVVALLQEASIVRVAGETDVSRQPLEELYRHAIAGVGPPLARIAEIIASSPGPTLLHCTVGKDRTGLVAAVILSAVGVDDEDIVADYVLTEANMPRVLARLASAPDLEGGAALVERLAETNPNVLSAPAAAIAAALGELGSAGGSAAWLRRHGLSEDALANLCRRLVDGPA